MNELFASLGIEALKPVLGWLVMPPLPLLLIALLGAMLLQRRRRLGWSLLMAAWLGIWATSTPALGIALIQGLTQPPPALDARAVAGLAGLGQSPKTAIVVLGAGRKLLAPEYAGPDLSALGSERLRYGLWLARRSGLPVAFSGGLSYFGRPGPSEAEIAKLVAKRDYGMTLRWTEGQSRDTNENAVNTVALLRAEGIQRIVLVTHDFHMQRAMAGFKRALTRREGPPIALLAAPLGGRVDAPLGLTDFLPSAEGLAATRLALHEWLGWLAGA